MTDTDQGRAAHRAVASERAGAVPLDEVDMDTLIKVLAVAAIGILIVIIAKRGGT